MRCQRGAWRLARCAERHRSSLRIVLQVYEETGFDITPLIVERDFIEITSNQQRTKLYIVANVDEQVRTFRRAVQLCRHAHPRQPHALARLASRRKQEKRSARLLGIG